MINDLELIILKECLHPTIGMSHQFHDEHKLTREQTTTILNYLHSQGLIFKDSVSLQTLQYCQEGLFLYKITPLGGYFLRT